MKKFKIGDKVVFQSLSSPYHYYCSVISSIKEIHSRDGTYTSKYRLYKVEDSGLDYIESDLMSFKEFKKKMAKKELTWKKYVEWVLQKIEDKVKSKEGY